MNDYDTDFKSSLNDTPPLPGDLFARVETGVKRRAAVSRSYMSIAASVLVCAAAIGYNGVAPLLRAPYSAPAMAVPAESRDNLEDDLKSIVSYINGSDLDSQMVAYSLADNSL